MTLVDRVASAVVSATVVVVACVGSGASVAHAQSPQAEALFRDGRHLIKAGKLAAGCDKLAASERIETSVGTLLNLGDCREKLGKLASAWAAFRKAEALAKRTTGDDKRQAEAGRRASQLEPRLSNLVIEIGPRVAGMVVRRDGEIVDPAEWNTALPVDPGSYTIAAEAPGRAPWQTTVTVPAGARRQVVVIPNLEPVAPAPVAAAAAPWPPPRPELAPRTVVHVEAQRSMWTPARVTSAVIAVAGAGALGTGVYFGLHARDLEHRANQRCPMTMCGDPEGLRLNDQAHTAASRANLFYVAGGVTLATAAVLWVLGAPGEVAVVPAAGNGQLGFAMTGSF
ncbi:MAG TPA: tetratricopeptide repeat protein [Kofleriaceae bacterium]|jgi:hypothetical protein